MFFASAFQHHDQNSKQTWKNVQEHNGDEKWISVIFHHCYSFLSNKIHTQYTRYHCFVCSLLIYSPFFQTQIQMHSCLEYKCMTYFFSLRCSSELANILYLFLNNHPFVDIEVDYRQVVVSTMVSLHRYLLFSCVYAENLLINSIFVAPFRLNVLFIGSSKL